VLAGITLASLHGAAQKKEEQSPGVLSLHEIITPSMFIHADGRIVILSFRKKIWCLEKKINQIAETKKKKSSLRAPFSKHEKLGTPKLEQHAARRPGK
jgi:hypothetical protein